MPQVLEMREAKKVERLKRRESYHSSTDFSPFKIIRVRFVKYSRTNSVDGNSVPQL